MALNHSDNQLHLFDAIRVTGLPHQIQSVSNRAHHYPVGFAVFGGNKGNKMNIPHYVQSKWV